MKMLSLSPPAKEKIWILTQSKYTMLQPKKPTKYNIKILKTVVKSTFATKKILKTLQKHNKNRSEVNILR